MASKILFVCDRCGVKAESADRVPFTWTLWVVTQNNFDGYAVLNRHTCYSCSLVYNPIAEATKVPHA